MKKPEAKMLLEFYVKKSPFFAFPISFNLTDFFKQCAKPKGLKSALNLKWQHYVIHTVRKNNAFCCGFILIISTTKNVS